MISLGASALILRRKLGVSQRDAALALGLTEQEVGGIESEEIALTDELLDRYLSVWGVDLTTLAWCESPDYSRLPKSVQKISADLGDIWREEIKAALEHHAQAKLAEPL